MKRRILAMLLAAAMAVGLVCGAVPTASADTGPGGIEAGMSVSQYRIESAELAKMLVQYGESGHAEVDGVSITFQSSYLLWGRTFHFYQPDPVNSGDWITVDAFSNLASSARPDNIHCLTIRLSGDGGTLTIPADALTWDCVEASPGVYRYLLKLRDPAVSTVTFLWQELANLHWSEYATRTVATGEALGADMPDPPEWPANHFVGWEIGSSDGTGEVFTADTVVTGDLVVYARKVTAQGGSQYHVMPAQLKEVALEYAVAAGAGDGLTAGDLEIIKLAVNGAGDDTTNPDYFDNGWTDRGAGTEYYYIYNQQAWAADSDPQYQNTRIPPEEITGLTVVYATGDGAGEASVVIPAGELALKVIDDAIIEIWMADALDGEDQTCLYTIGYYIDDGQQPADTQYGTAAAGTWVSAAKVDDYTQQGYLLYPGDQETSFLVSGEGSNDFAVRLYTDTDGDGCPDIREIRVTYQITGGTWSDGTSGDRTYLLQRNESGGAFLGDTVPEGMLPGQGFQSTGSWSPAVPTKDTVVTQETTYRYAFPLAETVWQVNYHIVGDVRPEPDAWMVETADGSSYSLAQAPELTGYVFDGWYASAQDVGQADKRVGIPGDTVTVTGQYQLYGRYVPGEAGPQAPAADELTGGDGLLRESVQVVCGKVAGHSALFDLEQSSIRSIGAAVVENGVWTCPVVIGAEPYVAALNAQGGETHRLDDEQTKTITLYWDPAAQGNAGAWTRPDGLPVTIQAVCGGSPADPTPDVPPVNPQPQPDHTPDYAPYEPQGLNTQDHVAYLIGYEDGTIRPEADITRGEVAAIFFRLLTEQVRAAHWSTGSGFADVDGEDWFNVAVSTMASLGIVDGYEDGTFRPGQPVTRGEFTAIATRFFDYAARYEQGAFTDVAGDEWYADHIQAGTDLGLIDGYPDGSFRPEESITRAEAAAIVNRVLNRRPHGDRLLDEAAMNTWPDNPEGAWYYVHIQEASNTHDYSWVLKDGETVERWTAKLPDPDWDELEQGLG